MAAKAGDVVVFCVGGDTKASQSLGSWYPSGPSSYDFGRWPSSAGKILERAEPPIDDTLLSGESSAYLLPLVNKSFSSRTSCQRCKLFLVLAMDLLPFGFQLAIASCKSRP